MSRHRPTIRLVSWKEDRASELAAELVARGFAVDTGAVDGPALRALGQSPPDAVVIDLGRLPAQGRDVGIMLRTRVTTRHVPLIFVDGTEDKIARTRETLPDAVYATRAEMSVAVAGAIADPSAEPVVPSSNLAGYSGTPLPKKLGVKPGSTVALVDAPRGFIATLGELPEGVTVQNEAGADAQVTLWFVQSLDALEDGIERMAQVAGKGRLWVCWPKKASGIVTDVTQNHIRSSGLATGLVDFKICAIDSTWSGLCFTRRKK
jgi:CheY-like chemotaxis protein